MPADKIKLCILIPSFQCGGSERFVTILCNNINTNRFTVELYILDGANPFYKINNPAVKVVFLNIKKVRKSLSTIISITKKSKPDILFSVSNHLNVFLSIFKFLLPKKMLLVARETSIVSINKKNIKYGILYNNLIKKFYKNIDYIICQSAYMQEDLISNYKIKREKTIVIYNPVESFGSQIINMTGVIKPVYKFFTVARLSPEKGIERILRSLSLVKKDFIYHVFGDGILKNELLELSINLGLHNRIVFHGQQMEPYANMQDADFFLLGSHFEGLPNVLLEAGMLGIPTIAYNSPGGIQEIIQNGINGFLVEANGPPEQFSNAINKGIHYNFYREKITAITKEKFSVDKIIKEIENFFLEVSSTHK